MVSLSPHSKHVTCHENGRSRGLACGQMLLVRKILIEKSQKVSHTTKRVACVGNSCQKCMSLSSLELTATSTLFQIISNRPNRTLLFFLGKFVACNPLMFERVVCGNYSFVLVFMLSVGGCYFVFNAQFVFF